MAKFSVGQEIFFTSDDPAKLRGFYQRFKSAASGVGVGPEVTHRLFYGTVEGVFQQKRAFMSTKFRYQIRVPTKEQDAVEVVVILKEKCVFGKEGAVAGLCKS
jgi:hypothetical protein